MENYTSKEILLYAGQLCNKEVHLEPAIMHGAVEVIVRLVSGDSVVFRHCPFKFHHDQMLLQTLGGKLLHTFCVVMRGEFTLNVSDWHHK